MGKPKILVIRGGAIGDFILTIPAIAALRERFPDAQLDILGYPKIVSLALRPNLADHVRHIEARPLAGFFARNGALAIDWSDYFSGFAIILSYLYDPDGIFRDNIARCSKAQFIQGPHRPDENEPLHAVKVFLKPLERLAIYDTDPSPALRLPEPATKSSTTLALHPGSGSEAKNWPESKWRELLVTLEKTRLSFLIVGGEAEGDRLNNLASCLPAGRVEVAQNLPLPELALRLQTCTAFVGHDSGITHLAAAIGLPCLVLWAHTNLSVWQPAGKQIVLIHETRGLQTLSAQRVADELAKLLPAGSTD